MSPTTPGSTGNPTTDTLRDIADQLRTHIENKEWDKLAQLLNVPSIWFMDANLPQTEAIARIRATLDKAEDIELSIQRLLKARIEESVAEISMVVRLLWSEAGTWKENQSDVNMHIGFQAAAPDQWKISYFGLTPAVMEQEDAEPVPSEEAAYFAAAAAPAYFRAAAAPAYFGAASMAAAPGYFGAAAPGYFTGLPVEMMGMGAPPPPPEKEAPAEVPQYVTIFMPTIVPTDIFLRMFKKS